MTEPTDVPADTGDDVPVRTVNPPQAVGEATIDVPVMDGAAQLQEEAAEAIESGDVDLWDPRHGGPPMVEEPDRSERPDDR